MNHIDATLAVCGTLIVVNPAIAEQKGRKSWMTPVELRQAVPGFVIVMFGDEFSTNL